MMNERSNTPSVEHDESMIDRKSPAKLPSLSLNATILPQNICPLGSPFVGQLNPLDMLSVRVREYTVLLRHPGCDEIATETILLDACEVELTEKEGFMGAVAILEMRSYVFGYELIHVCEGCKEYRLSINQWELINSRAFKWAHDMTNKQEEN